MSATRTSADSRPSDSLPSPVSPPLSPPAHLPKIIGGGSLIVAWQLKNKNVLVIGANKVAFTRVLFALDADAHVTVIAPPAQVQLAPEFLSLATSHKIHLSYKSPTREDLLQSDENESPSAVLVATDDDQLAVKVSKWCKDLGIPVNVANHPDLCDFWFTSSYRDGPIQIAVSTNGSGQSLANKIRNYIAQSLPKSLGSSLQKIKFLKESLDRLDSSQSHVVSRLNQICESWPIEALAHFDDSSVQSSSQPSSKNQGKIQLVGAGPGSVDLLTFGAIKAISQADVVISDKLVHSSILQFVTGELQVATRSQGKAVEDQKRLMDMTIAAAQAGKTVVRLKIGDPFLFGRGGEEILYFRKHGFEPEVLPGVSSAFAAPALANIPITHRGVADQVLIATGRSENGGFPEVPYFSPKRTTVFLMATNRIRQLVEILKLRGYPNALAACVVEKAYHPDQRWFYGVIENLADLIENEEVTSPTTIIIGNSVDVLNNVAKVESDAGLPKTVTEVATEDVINDLTIASPTSQSIHTTSKLASSDDEVLLPPSSLHDGSTVISSIALKTSDLIFVYPSLPTFAPHLGDHLLRLSQEDLEINIHSQVPSIHHMPTRPGALRTILGAAVSSSNITVLTASPGLSYMYSTIKKLAAQKLARKSTLVVHVGAASHVHSEEAVLDKDSDLDTPIEKFSDDFTSVHLLKSLPVPIFVSHSPQDSQYSSIVTFVISKIFSIPTIHVVDHIRTLFTPSDVSISLLPASVISKLISVLTSRLTQSSNVLGVTKQLMQLLGKLTRSTFAPFEYSGHPEPSTVIVTLGASFRAVETTIVTSPDLRVGAVNVRLLRPWSSEDLVEVLPKSVKRVAVLEVGEGNELYKDVIGSFNVIANEEVPEVVYGRVDPTEKLSPEGVLALFKELGRSSNVAEFVLSTKQVDSSMILGPPTRIAPLQSEVSLPSFLPSSYNKDLHLRLKLEAERHNAPVTSTHTITTALKQLLLSEVYNTSNPLRPDIAKPGSDSPYQRTYQVRLVENKRLTPHSYDRNVFHLELDVTGTGLKYDIGDALGIHGHNDSQEALDFLAFYNLNPDDIVSLPPTTSRTGTIHNTAKTEYRTIYQLFTQVLDLFGRPSKRFYEALAHHATAESEKQQLLHLISAEGAADFKSRVDETITYADILYEFPSAHPPLHYLVSMIPPIKPRHYSIASSQKMHPNSVNLLIVAVDWVTPKGKKRYGQCTRYLLTLKPDSLLTVSLKPSVMKLPPNHAQPVIMAGLGTGLAPHMAFIEERAFLKTQGHEVGPMVLYFGSRTRKAEYLYGELLELYQELGVVDLRLAFSRDLDENGGKKVYIQHRIREDMEQLAEMMLNKEGCFYLCGPGKFSFPLPFSNNFVMCSLF
ncbi:hypothetical protein BKA69DRAFT_201706 [Paraphysoderma sedebokerense]|nr:hypothetical protein BKA69DRAFT_201706 [Paraphysoderma sedebokerense]